LPGARSTGGTVRETTTDLEPAVPGNGGVDVEVQATEAQRRLSPGRQLPELALYSLNGLQNRYFSALGEPKRHRSFRHPPDFAQLRVVGGLS
jgi:hypothetical protein